MYLVAEKSTHSPDLPVQSLGQDDAEGLPACFFHKAFPCDGIQNGNACGHFPDKIRGDLPVYSDQIFFFVEIAGAHDPVYQIALIGQKQKTLGILVQTAYRINPHRVVQIFGYRCFLALFFGAADNAAGLIKKKEHLTGLCLNRFSVKADQGVRGNPFSCGYRYSVDRDPACIGIKICLPPGTDSGTAEIFVYSDSMFVCYFFHCFII